jgi:hypothetical protein
VPTTTLMPTPTPPTQSGLATRSGGGRRLAVRFVALICFCAATLVSGEPGPALAQPPAPAAPLIEPPPGPAVLYGAWMRIVPPPVVEALASGGWQRVRSPFDRIRFDARNGAGTADFRTLDFTRPADPAAVSEALVQLARRLSDLPADVWTLDGPPRIVGPPGGAATTVQVSGRRGDGTHRTVILLPAADDLPRAVVGVIDGSGLVTEWDNADARFRPLEPVDDTAGLLMLPLVGTAVPIPSGLSVRSFRDAAVAAVGEPGEANSRVRQRLLVASMPVDGDDLDAAFGPFERELERTIGMQRDGGEPLRVAAEPLIPGGAIRTFDGFLGVGGFESSPERRFAVWYGYDAGSRQMLVVYLEGATADRAGLRADVERMARGLHTPPRPPESRVDKAAIVAVVDGPDLVFGVVLLEEGTERELPVVLLDRPITVIEFAIQIRTRRLVTGSGLSLSGTRALLPGGRLGEEFRVPIRELAGVAPREIRLRADVQVSGAESKVQEIIALDRVLPDAAGVIARATASAAEEPE